MRSGVPVDVDQWEWTCGFYPGSQPGEHRHGTAATFDQARADFEGAWRVFLANRTEADFQEWRHARNWHEKNARSARIPAGHPDTPCDGEHACVCGGAGMPCPQCNPSDLGHPPRPPAGTHIEFDKKGWRH